MILRITLLVASLTIGLAARADGQQTVKLQGVVVDAESGRPLAARLYVRSTDGAWYFARSTDSRGSAVEYRKQRFEHSVEMHTTLSAHPFAVELPAGRYTVTVERGKEYLPFEREIEIGEQSVPIRVELKRWIDMAARGWYSGDTHVHRSLAELPNLMLAEDLNVALPLTYWVTQAYTPPLSSATEAGSEVRAEPIRVDETHLIYPINTEYEIFTVKDRRHTLGAVFILGHRTPLRQGAPPVAPIAAAARHEGALLDLDKHSWPWSLMLVPVMNVDLYELANNHVWRTQFGFRNWSLETVPDYMRLQRDGEGLTEWGWIDFGFQTYYALLNCGFRLRPTAGTASGVHPVPLGFGRVYVQPVGGFDYARWMKALGQGRSFVTTGPMLDVSVAGTPPGAAVEWESGKIVRVQGTADSAVRLRVIELLVNGQVVRSITPTNHDTSTGAFTSSFDERLPIAESSWIAVRVFEERPDGRVRFAHSSPVHLDVPGKPLRPRRDEIDYLVQRMQEELARNQDVLSDDQLQEYRQALSIYQRIAENAR